LGRRRLSRRYQRGKDKGETWHHAGHFHAPSFAPR
jgi:hypothetical protein